MALSYFIADVHLGSRIEDPADRFSRFLRFLKSIKAEETENVFLMGDIWDFWWEYGDVIPKGSERILAVLEDLIEAGVKVWFFEGNHDQWEFGYFEQIGIRKVEQPYVIEIGGKTFCLGHGDYLGPSPLGYRFLYHVLHCKPIRWAYSLLHPRIAFAFATGTSHRNRKRHYGVREYIFKVGEEPICKFAQDFAETTDVDHFIFGHYHARVEWSFTNSRGVVSSFHILGDWFLRNSPLIFDSETGKFLK